MAGVHWVVNAYLLLLAVLVAFGGRVADLLGPERTFRAGTVTVRPRLRAVRVARSEAGVIAARGLQGIGAAMMVPSTGALIINAFDVRERGKAMGIYTGVSMVFLALGPLVGGLLTQGVSWRAVFFINLPIGLVIVAAAHYTLPHRPLPRIANGAIDWVGFPLLLVGLGSLVLGLMQGQTWGWGSPVSSPCWPPPRCCCPPSSGGRPAPRAARPALAVPPQNFGADSVILAGVQFALIGASVFGAIWSQQVLGFGRSAPAWRCCR